jgi:hypothetical protein
MNPRTTLGLLLLATVLSGYIYLFELRLADAASTRSGKLFPNLDPARVNSIEILRSNSVIYLERVKDRWRLTPPGYPAQATQVENWLGLLRTLNRRAFISAQELLAQPGGSAAFGVDHPQATVTLQQGTGRISFHVGSRTPVGEQLYLQLVGSDGLFVTESALADRLPQSSVDWREPTFLNLSGLDFNRFYVRARNPAGTRDFTLERDSATRLWRLTRPRSARADNGLLELVLQELQTVRISQFVSDLPGSDLEPYGLHMPDVTLVFGLGADNVLTAEFGASPANAPGLIYARRSNYPNNIVAVPKQAAELLRVPYTEFLDRRLVRFTPADVNRIEVRAGASFALEKQTDGGWRAVEPVSFPADPALVNGFLNQLNSLPIAEITKEVATESDLPGYGLAPPARQYILKDGNGPSNTNSVLAQIEFGTNRAGRVFVRRADENSIYALKTEDTLELAQAGFELRDRRIWNFTTNQVLSVTIDWKDKSWKLLRTGNGQWSFAPGSQGIINPYALEESLYRIGQLWAKAWIPAGGADRFGLKETAHRLSIELNDGDKHRTLAVEFGGPSPSGGPYAATELETGRTVFEFPFEIFQYHSEVLRALNESAVDSP